VKWEPRKSKGRTSLLEFLPFDFLLNPNRSQLLLLTYDTLFQFPHSYKKFENLLSGEPANSKPFGIQAEGLFYFKIFYEKRRIFNKLYSIYKIVTKKN